jgi:hypothetical protein
MAALKLHIRDFFNTRMELREKLLRSWCIGGTGWSSGWCKTFCELQKLGVRVNGSDINDISISSVTPRGQAEEALGRLQGLIITVEVLCVALRNALLIATADDIERNAVVSSGGGGGNTFITVMPALAPMDTSLVSSPPIKQLAVASSSRRLVSALPLIEEGVYVIYKVPYVNAEYIDDRNALSNVELQRVKLMKGKRQAEEEVDRLMDEDVEAVGGEEHKIQHDYIVLPPFCSSASPAKKEVKKRTKERAVFSSSVTTK